MERRRPDRRQGLREVREAAGAREAPPRPVPGAFPNLAAYTKDRADLDAILLTGIPTGVVDGFQNFTTTKPSDMLRLNVAIPPTTDEPERPRPDRRRRRRLPERAPGVRRRRLDRAQGDRRRDDPARRPSFTPDGAVGAVSSYITPGNDRYQDDVPVSRHTSRRIRHALVVSHNHDHSTDVRPEHVMLDLGPGVGALVLHTDASLHGHEIEISPAGSDDERSHKQVHERPAGGRPLYAAVFESLPEGEYTLWLARRAAAAQCRRGGLGRDRTLTTGGTRMIGWTNPTHLVLLLGIALLLFGAKKLPEIGRGLGSGMREFKESVTHETPPSPSRRRRDQPVD